MSVGAQLKIDKPLSVDFVCRKRGSWTCNYRMTWPEEMTITATASSKSGAGKLAALKCLHWLHNNGKMKNGFPIVYESKVVYEMLHKPTGIDIEPGTLATVETLLARYNSEIKDLVDNKDSKISGNVQKIMLVFRIFRIL